MSTTLFIFILEPTVYFYRVDIDSLQLNDLYMICEFFPYEAKVSHTCIFLIDTVKYYIPDSFHQHNESKS